MTVSSQFIGEPCGQHGPYTFYKAFKYCKNGEKRHLSLGGFFLLQVAPLKPPNNNNKNNCKHICIGELQLLWVDRNSDQPLSSSRLYFLPENTVDGRGNHHGDDEVLAMSEKVVLGLDDLVDWITHDVHWDKGLQGTFVDSSDEEDLEDEEEASEEDDEDEDEDEEDEEEEAAEDEEDDEVVEINKKVVELRTRKNSSPSLNNKQLALTNVNSNNSNHHSNNHNNNGNYNVNRPFHPFEPPQQQSKNLSLEQLQKCFRLGPEITITNITTNNKKLLCDTPSNNNNNNNSNVNVNNHHNHIHNNNVYNNHNREIGGDAINTVTSVVTNKIDEHSRIPKSSPEVIIVSYPRYCRFRALLKRLEGVNDKLLKSTLIKALGGLTVPVVNTRILFCRDTFDFTALERHELLCNHLAPNLKGRPRKKRLKDKRSQSPSSESNESAEGKEKILCKIDKVAKNPTLPNGLRKELGGEDLEEQEFLQHLFKFMRERNTPIERVPHLGFKQINLYLFFTCAQRIGGYEKITVKKLWKQIYDELGGNPGSTSAATCTRRHYERLLLPYERHMKGEDYKPLPTIPSRPRKISSASAPGVLASGSNSPSESPLSKLTEPINHKEVSIIPKEYAVAHKELTTTIKKEYTVAHKEPMTTTIKKERVECEKLVFKESKDMVLKDIAQPMPDLEWSKSNNTEEEERKLYLNCQLRKRVKDDKLAEKERQWDEIRKGYQKDRGKQGAVPKACKENHPKPTMIVPPLEISSPNHHDSFGGPIKFPNDSEPANTNATHQIDKSSLEPMYVTPLTTAPAVQSKENLPTDMQDLPLLKRIKLEAGLNREAAISKASHGEFESRHPLGYLSDKVHNSVKHLPQPTNSSSVKQELSSGKSVNLIPIDKSDGEVSGARKCHTGIPDLLPRPSVIQHTQTAKSSNDDGALGSQTLPLSLSLSSPSPSSSLSSSARTSSRNWLTESKCPKPNSSWNTSFNYCRTPANVPSSSSLKTLPHPHHHRESSVHSSAMILQTPTGTPYHVRETSTAAATTPVSSVKRPNGEVHHSAPLPFSAWSTPRAPAPPQVRLQHPRSSLYFNSYHTPTLWPGSRERIPLTTRDANCERSALLGSAGASPTEEVLDLSVKKHKQDHHQSEEQPPPSSTWNSAQSTFEAKELDLSLKNKKPPAFQQQDVPQLPPPSSKRVADVVDRLSSLPQTRLSPITPPSSYPVSHTRSPSPSQRCVQRTMPIDIPSSQATGSVKTHKECTLTSPKSTTHTPSPSSPLVPSLYSGQYYIPGGKVPYFPEYGPQISTLLTPHYYSLPLPPTFLSHQSFSQENIQASMNAYKELVESGSYSNSPSYPFSYSPQLYSAYYKDGQRYSYPPD